MVVLVHSVLDTNYEIMFGTREEIGLDEENMGECKVYEKKILVCIELDGCTVEELRVKVQEIVAHEFLHAYLNEAGVDLTDGDEEKMCDFYMKNWRKLNNSILQVLAEAGFLDN